MSELLVSMSLRTQNGDTIEIIFSKMGKGQQRTNRKRSQPIPGYGQVAAPVLGGEIQIHQAHLESVQQTSNFRISTKCMQEYRRRNAKIIEWIQREYLAYYLLGTISVTEEQAADPRLHFFGRDRDFVYTGLNVEVIKAFMSVHKTKANGKHCSQVNIRKYHDAIQWGAEEVRQVLPLSYFVEMDAFLDSSKKEVVTHRRAGNLDEHEADPISFPFYQLICEWALGTGNVFLWVWTILQWNNMARSISIDPLGIHNFSVGTDSIKCKYDDSKVDKKGERVSPKNIYANPFEPVVCAFTALGCWLALRKGTFCNNDSLFLGTGQPGSAAHKYCENLSKLLTDQLEIVKEYARPGHANTHGIRKGAATHCTSGTTLGAALVAVARRGEWTQGSVYDIYFQFAEPGDQYLGRIIAGLDPNSPEFDVLPPHFKGGAQNENVKCAMELCFGPIIENHAKEHSVKGILLLCLASMVHHSDFLKSYVAKDLRHPFSLIPILNNDDLLGKLKKALATADDDDTMRPTGIPPHVRQLRMLQEVVKKINEVHVLQLLEIQQIKEVVRQAIEENDIRAGNVTLPALVERMEERHKEEMEAIKQTIEKTLETRFEDYGLKRREPAAAETSASTATGSGQYTYMYSGAFWDVPMGYQFPKKAL
jgi:hypothetical protein